MPSSSVGGRQTVMVVDDSDDVRELVVLQLRLCGFDVVEACGGREAVEIVGRNCPALILMDIQMPFMDGLAATRLIRGMAGAVGVLIVAFSAFGSGDNRQRALDAGCDDYVSKPVGVNQLDTIVRRLLRAA